MGHWDPRVTPSSVSGQEHWNLPVYLSGGRGVMWGPSSAQAHPGAQVALGAELRGWGSAAQVLAELAPPRRELTLPCPTPIPHSCSGLCEAGSHMTGGGSWASFPDSDHSPGLLCPAHHVVPVSSVHYPGETYMRHTCPNPRPRAGHPTSTSLKGPLSPDIHPRTRP